MELVEYANGTFTKRELERLIAYRAAVAAGFYTDQDGSTEPTEAAPEDATETKEAPAEAGATPPPPAR